MKVETEIRELLSSSYKQIEKELGIQIRNGQSVQGVKSALNWVLQNNKKGDGIPPLDKSCLKFYEQAHGSIWSFRKLLIKSE